MNYSIFRAARNGNFQAQRFWAMNRQPGDWRDKVSHEINAKVEMTLEQALESLDGLSDAEIDEQKMILEKAIKIMRRNELARSPSKLVN